MCNHWAQNGNAVTLIATFSGAKINHYRLDKNVALKYVNNSPLFPNFKLWNLIWKLIQLRKLIKNQRPDVVISFLARVNVATALAMIGIKCPLIISERTWPPFASLNNKFFWIYRILFRNVHRIIVQTDKSKAWLAQNFLRSNTKVIPNPAVYPVPLVTSSRFSPVT